MTHPNSFTERWNVGVDVYKRLPSDRKREAAAIYQKLSANQANVDHLWEALRQEQLLHENGYPMDDLSQEYEEIIAAQELMER